MSSTPRVPGATVPNAPKSAAHWWRGVLSLAVAVAVAAAAAYWTISVQNRAEAAREGAYLLAMLSADKYEALYVQETAILQHGLDSSLELELRAALHRGETRLGRLAELDGYTASIDTAFAAFRNGLEAEIVPLRAGRIEEARGVEVGRVDTAVDSLETAIAAELTSRERRAVRAELAAEVGSMTALSLAGLLIWGLGSVHRRSRRLAERVATTALETSERRFRSMVQQGSEMITILGTDLRPTYQSPSVERILGYQGSADSRWANELVHRDDRARVRARLLELLGEAPGCSALLECRVQHHDGSWRHVETIATNLLNEPTIGGLVLNARDVTERTVLEAQLAHRALHDPLTDLPNRALFSDRLEHALARAARGADLTAVALLDLDNFKAVNDTLGHAAGDELLAVVADRLSGCLRPSDTVARLGGDEFAVLLEATDELDAIEVAERMLEVLSQPITLAGRPIVVQGSVGVATSREAADATAVMRNADLAMYAAKSEGKGRAVVFHQGMRKAVQARMELEADLRHALENALVAGQFRLVYQPKVSLATRRITGMEALLRWQHPQRGMVPPAEFIPLAEETGLIVPIGAWVLEEACRQSAAWRAQDPDGPALSMSINVSGRQFEADLVDTVAKALAATGIAPATLCLEVTESVVMRDVEIAVATLRSLKDLGVQLSIDDFGTGYSSLSYLKRFPLDELKIDKSFVDGLGPGSQDEAIVAAIMGMATALDLRVVAEGVESEAQLVRLQALGCQSAQGYYFARPQPAAAMTALLVDGRAPLTTPGAATRGRVVNFRAPVLVSDGQGRGASDSDSAVGRMASGGLALAPAPVLGAEAAAARS